MDNAAEKETRPKPVQLPEAVARIEQVARERGIIAVMTMNTRQLSMLLFPDGRNHRKVTTRARNMLLSENCKRLADKLTREQLQQELENKPDEQKQLAEGVAIIRQFERKRGIFAVATMNAWQLSVLMFPNGGDRRKVATKARNVLMDEHRKRAADNLKRGELLATALRAEPKQPETEPSEQQPKLGTQLDTGRK